MAPTRFNAAPRQIATGLVANSSFAMRLPASYAAGLPLPLEVWANRAPRFSSARSANVLTPGDLRTGPKRFERDVHLSVFEIYILDVVVRVSRFTLGQASSAEVQASDRGRLLPAVASYWCGPREGTGG